MTHREWDSPTRAAWNALIKQCLDGIDRHNSLYFSTGNPWHLRQADWLRQYVVELKDWIHRHERAGSAEPY